MPKDIKREFLTGPRKFDEIMEKLEINRQRRHEDTNDVSYLERVQKLARERARRDRMSQERGIVGDTGAKKGGKKGPQGSKPDRHGDKDKGSKGKGKGQQQRQQRYPILP